MKYVVTQVDHGPNPTESLQLHLDQTPRWLRLHQVIPGQRTWTVIYEDIDAE